MSSIAEIDARIADIQRGIAAEQAALDSLLRLPSEVQNIPGNARGIREARSQIHDGQVTIGRLRDDRAQLQAQMSARQAEETSAAAQAAAELARQQQQSQELSDLRELLSSFLLEKRT